MNEEEMPIDMLPENYRRVLDESPIKRTIVKLPRDPKTISPIFINRLANSNQCIANFTVMQPGEKYGIEKLTRLILELGGMFDSTTDFIDAIPNPWSMVDEVFKIKDHVVDAIKQVDTKDERTDLWDEFKDISGDEAIALLKTLVVAIDLAGKK